MVEDNRKEQLKKAQQKFKKIGTNVRIDFAEEIVMRCAERETTISKYVLGLLEDDFKNKANPATDEELIKELRLRLRTFVTRTPLEEIVRGFKRLLGKE